MKTAEPGQAVGTHSHKDSQRKYWLFDFAVDTLLESR
jgi:hypothetical protein